MCYRFENAAAWLLSEPDESRRNAAIPQVRAILQRYGDVVSFNYGGERDQTSIVMADTMFCLGRFFPSWAYDRAGSGEKYRVQIDFVEKKKFSDLRVRHMRTIAQQFDYGDAKYLTGTPCAFLLDDTYWVLLPEHITLSIQSFVNDAFRFEPLRKAMQLEKLDEDQKLLFEAAVTRIALETAIHHELGHILHGHSRPGDTAFLPFIQKHPALAGVNCSEWINAKEMAADDYAAMSLTASLVARRFFTFPSQQELEDVGPYAFMNALFFGVCIYYIIQQKNRLADLQQEARGREQELNSLHEMRPYAETVPATPRCAGEFPCRTTGKCRFECMVSGYPTVPTRMRYFFMTFCDSRKEAEEIGDGDMSASHKFQVVLKGLGLYLQSLHQADPKSLLQFDEIFTWMSLYNSPDVTWLGGEGELLLSKSDSDSLMEAQKESDEAEARVLAEIKPQYDRFKFFEPYWRKLTRTVANAQ